MPKETGKSDGYSWEEYFAPHILERGWGYYREGAVINLTEENAGEFSATVQGTDDYRVEIEMEDGVPICMECDCPYADGGYNCKHMAAVLYAIEDNDTVVPDGEEDEDLRVSEAESIDSLISRIPDDELRNVLAQVCRDHETVYRQLSLRYTVKISSEYLKKLHWELERIRDEFSDRNGFVSWRYAGDFEIAVTDFLTRNTETLVERGELMLAFRFVNDTLRFVGEQDIDDDGQLIIIAHVGADCWSMVLAAASSSEKEELFRWFTECMNDKNQPYYLEDTVADFYEKEFQEPYFLEKKLELCQVSGPIPSNIDYRAYHSYEHKVEQQLVLMEKLSYPDEEIWERIRKFYKLHKTRAFAIDYELKLDRTDKAIELLRESKELDAEYPGLVSDYSNRLIRLYEKTGREKECKQELIYQIFRCRQNNTDNIGMLKNRCSQSEWEEQRERIFAARTCSEVCHDLMAKEGLDERLLESVRQSGSLYTLDEYEKRLKRKFPEKLRDAYVTCMKKAMLSAGNRDQYAGVIRYLKKITRYPDGKEIAIQIAAEWRRDYPRRRAMLDELSRAGF